MRLICCMAALVALLLRAFMPRALPVDIAVIVDISGLEGEEALDEPWLASPCVNPAHCYLRPLSVRGTGETYPASEDGTGYAQGEYRFCRAFIFEAAARGWRPWEEHFEKLENGAYAHVTAGVGCVSARGLCIENAAALIAGLVACAPSCRVALCPAGERFDTRFAVNFTRDTEKLTNALYAAEPSAWADMETAKDKAAEYFARRSADSRRTRRTLTVIVTADADAAKYCGADTLVLNVLEEDAETFLRRLFPPEGSPVQGVLRPSPIFREEEERA